MPTRLETITVPTTAPIELVDITAEVAKRWGGPVKVGAEGQVGVGRHGIGIAAKATAGGSEVAVAGVIAAARAYASRTRGIILQNLVWAAGYNLGAVPAAAAGLIPPWAAAIGMSLSSLIVVANSLRLRSRAEPRQSRYLAGFADREPAA